MSFASTASALHFIVVGGIQAATPIAIAGVGSAFAGKVRVFLVAMEAMFLCGAFAALWGADRTGSVWVGLAAAGAAGALVGLMFAYLVVRRGAHEVVVGVGVNMAAAALTAILLVVVFSSSGAYLSSSAGSIPTLYSKITWMAPLALALALLAHFVLYSTRAGLRMRAIGSDPDAAMASGLDVVRYRFVTVVIGGAACGVAGANLSVGGLGLFSIEMSAGLGFIALAATMVGDNRPLQTAATALLFGLATSTAIQLQTYGLPSDFLLAMPYVVTMVAMTVKGWRAWSRRGGGAARSAVEEALS